MRQPFLLLASTALLISPALADDPRGDYPDAPAHTPEEEKALFHLPPGFEIQLVAAEPEIQKPINLNFDTQGRLWVTGSEQYPWPASVDAVGTPIPNFEKSYQDIANAFAGGKQPPPISNTPKDTVRILSDFDKHGHARKVEVFADGLNIPSGIQPLPRKPGAKGDTAIVYSLPYVWRMEDTDGDGKADKREILYGPFGFLDTHGGCSSYIQWMDGWIYATLGFRNHSEVKDRNGQVTVFDSGNTVRFQPDGSKIEYYTHGQTNPFGLAFDPLGNLYSADSHSKPVYLLLHGGYYEGINKQHDGLGFAPRVTDDDHGSSAIGGMVYYADDKWPEEFRGNTFNGNVVTRRINRDKLEWHGATPKAIRQPDFLVSDDKWFRPVNIKLGPDGAMWIADFYNPIIGHYEVPLTHPKRDHAHGRIWRVVYVGDQKDATPQPPALPDLSKLDAKGLVNVMGSANLEVRRLAVNETVERVGPPAVPALQRILRRERPAKEEAELAPMTARFVSSLWAMDRLGGGRELSVSCDPFSSENSSVLSSAVRIAFRNDEATVDSAAIFGSRLASLPSKAKFAFIDEIGQHPSAMSLEPLLKGLKDTPPEDSELVYAYRMALRNNLTAPGAYKVATEMSGRDAKDGERFADVSLGLPTPESAEFLLAYLKSTQLQSARSGDFLKHAALHIATDRISEVLQLGKDFPGAPLEKRLGLADGLLQAARVRGLKLSDEANAWIKSVTLQSLASPDEGTLKRAIEAVRNDKDAAKLEPLAKIAADKKQNSPLRTAALDALANVDTNGAVLASALADPSSQTLRKRAAELLGQMNSPAGVSALANALATAPTELATSISGSLAKSDSGAEALLVTIEAGKASAGLLRQNAVSGPLNMRGQPLKDRAAALTKDLPPEDARLDKVIADRANAYRTAKPNAEHGAQVFQQNCVICHRLKGNGGNIGPNLDGIASRGVQRLVEDILDPSRNVDPAFRQTILETTDGRILAGVGLRENGQLLVMSDATGKEVSAPKDQVKSQTSSRLSLMPPTFEQVLAPDDLNDLIAFLMAQSAAAQ